MKNNTNLLGGQLALFIILSSINLEYLLNSPRITVNNNVFFQIASTIAIAASAVPIGYIVNQIWMTVYNCFFDVHCRIFITEKEEVFRHVISYKWYHSKKWYKGLLLELKLALLHRKNAEFSSEAWLSWHRNRLNQLHSNGSIILALFISSVISIIISLTSKNDYFLHPFTLYIHRRWWVLLIAVIVSISCYINARRAFIMIVIYNMSAIFELCNENCKKNLKCRYCCDFKIDITAQRR